MSGESPAAIIYDVSGSLAVDVAVDEDGQNRLQVRSDFPADTILQVTLAPITRDPSGLILQRLLNSGSADMLIDGSNTPGHFIYSGSLSNEVALTELRFFMSADNINFVGGNFGPLLNPLTNGVRIEVFASGTLAAVAVVKVNEDLGLVGSPQTVFYQNTGPSDSLAVSIPLNGIVLEPGGSDFVRVTIQDDLTNVKFKFFQSEIQAVKKDN